MPVVTFTKEDVPTFAALKASSTDANLSAEDLSEVLLEVDEKDFGTNPSRWLAACYLIALYAGRSMADLSAPVSHDSLSDDIKNNFEIQVERFFGVPDLEAATTVFFHSWATDSDELVHYLVLVRLMFPSNILGVVSRSLRSDDEHYVAPALFYKAIQMQDALEEEGIVISFSSALELADEWTLEEVILMLENNIPPSMAAAMLKGGVSSVERAIHYRKTVHETILKDMFNL